METIQRVKAWRTADDKIISFDDITHQHWSNIFWYHLVFQKVPGVRLSIMQRTFELAKSEIEVRFDGDTLSWEPIYSYELEWLIELNLIKGNEIYFDGVRIGCIELNNIITI